jgi:hypothetical protein
VLENFAYPRLERDEVGIFSKMDHRPIRGDIIRLVGSIKGWDYPVIYPPRWADELKHLITATVRRVTSEMLRRRGRNQSPEDRT